MTSNDTHATEYQKDENREEYILGETNAEIERLQKQHKWMLRVNDGRIIFAPIDKTRENLKVLDMACADGTLLREMSKQLPPSASFVGIDLVEAFLPKKSEDNFRYLAQDALEHLPQDMRRAFDLVNVRLMFAAFPDYERTHRVVRNLVDGLKPGAWLQIKEMCIWWDPSTPDAQGVKDLRTVLRTMLGAMGVGEGYPMGLEDALKEVGLVQVGVEILDCPFGKAIVHSDEELRQNSVDHWKLTIQGLVGGCEKIGANLPKAVTDHLVERFTRDALEHGGVFRMAVFTGRKPAA